MYIPIETIDNLYNLIWIILKHNPYAIHGHFKIWCPIYSLGVAATPIVNIANQLTTIANVSGGYLGVITYQEDRYETIKVETNYASTAAISKNISVHIIYLEQQLIRNDTITIVFHDYIYNWPLVQSLLMGTQKLPIVRINEGDILIINGEPPFKGIIENRQGCILSQLLASGEIINIKRNDFGFSVNGILLLRNPLAYIIANKCNIANIYSVHNCFEDSEDETCKTLRISF